MRLGLIQLMVAALTLLSGCEKSGLEKGQETAASPDVSNDAFAKEYEKSKEKAVREFPDLGKAGTPMNSRFVAIANQWKEQKSHELKDPNWPYLLAVKMNAEALAPPKPESNKGNVGGEIDGIGRVYSVQDLKTMKTLPSAAVVMGRVTKFDEIGLPMGVLSVVLDDALKCEVTMCELGSHDHFAWQRSGSSILLVRQLNRAGLGPAASLSLGQVFRVEGAFVQRSGKPVLVGTAKYN